VVQVDLPAAFAVGQIYALLSRDYLKKEPDIFKNKMLGPLNIYLSCGLSMTGLFLLVGWPSWEVMYTMGKAENPFNRPLAAAFYIFFVIGMMVLGNIGYMLAHYWYKKGKDKWVILGSIIGLIATFSPFLVKWGVWWKVGTYVEVTGGGGVSFWSPPFFYGWLAIMSYFTIVTILMGYWFRRQGSRLV
jgi:hypothetical protein